MTETLLLANGEITRTEYQLVQNKTFHKIIAADGAVKSALEFNLKPDLVIGDLDSATQDLRNKLPDCQWLHRPSQYSNDLEKCLAYCRQHGLNHLTLLGTLGKRIDHTLNNLSILCHYLRYFHLTILGPHEQVFLVNRHISLNNRSGQTVSLMALNQVGGITTRGLRYPVHDATMAFGQWQGLSNVIVAPRADIRITAGCLLVIIPY